ncbi:MAG: Cyclohexanone monooxygenase [Acidimicrobiales bacterium]|nr:Cyclohexanone monooxygenase [Acidimicrobiales bacterium]
MAIIGSGFGGIGMAVRLRQAGIETFTIHEKADRLGGTWRDNSYPGAACDVPSHLYSLSFAPKADWSRKFPEQPEILAYLESVAEQFGLGPHLAFGSEVIEATFDEGKGCWHLAFADGSTDEVDVVVSATGQLNRPMVPDLPGLDGFAGTSFHSARWDHDHDLTGRDVAVVGIGASAIQFVPEIAKVARSVTLFQRSVNFVAPKPDGEFTDRAKVLFRLVPPLQRLYRASIWLRFEARWSLFTDGSRTAPVAQKRFEKGLGQLVSAGLPADAVLPDYPLGCKRILISNDWYPTLLRPNVEVVTSPIDEVTSVGIVAGGVDHPADTIVFGTGFQTTTFLAPMRVTGRGRRDLHDSWSDGAEAHLGITVSGFPNLFLLYGPNTNLGHNSIVFMLERQISYVLTCVRTLIEDDLPWRDVTAEAQARSNGRLLRELDRTVWAAGCHSWYKTASGRITNNWSGPSARYWLRTARPRTADFRGPGSIREPDRGVGRVRASATGLRSGPHEETPT